MSLIHKKNSFRIQSTAGRFKFSVIFGVGAKKYRTSVVKDPAGNPDWNEESVM